MHGFTYQVLSIDILPDVRLPFLLTSIHGRIVFSLYISYWSTISIIYLLLLTIYEKSRKDSIRNLKDISK